MSVPERLRPVSSLISLFQIPPLPMSDPRYTPRTWSLFAPYHHVSHLLGHSCFQCHWYENYYPRSVPHWFEYDWKPHLCSSDFRRLVGFGWYCSVFEVFQSLLLVLLSLQMVRVSFAHLPHLVPAPVPVPVPGLDLDLDRSFAHQSLELSHLCFVTSQRVARSLYSFLELASVNWSLGVS